MTIPHALGKGDLLVGGAEGRDIAMIFSKKRSVGELNFEGFVTYMTNKNFILGTNVDFR
jgi:hypothetical protein